MRILAALVFAAALALAGCSASSDPVTTTSVATTIAAPGEGEAVRLALDDARQRWAQAGLATYRYTFQDDCAECDPAERAPRDVVVWEGEEFDPGAQSPSVEEMFTEIEAALDAGLTVEARFDPQSGHPTEVAIDLESRPVDGGTRWMVTELQPGLPGDEVSVAVVAEAQQAWLASRPEAYEYTLSVFCDCPFEGSLTTRIHGEKVVSHQIHYDELSGGSVTPIAIDNMFADLAELMSSVEGVIEDGIQFTGSARFHPDLGYPVWVGVDLTVLRADPIFADLPERLVMTITDLRPIEVPVPEYPTDAFAALADAEQRWQESGIRAYTYELAFHNIRNADFTGPFTVAVEDGAVVSVHDAAGTEVSPERAAGATVEEMFREIEGYLEQGLETSVTYHEVWGHPVLAMLDLDALAVDAGVAFSVSRLVPGDGS
jgi:hypothetical protein